MTFEYHRVMPHGSILLYSDDMSTQARKTMAQIDAEREQQILSRKPLAPKGTCNYCGFSVPKLALWCSSPCANLYAEEKERLIR